MPCRRACSDGIGTIPSHNESEKFMYYTNMFRGFAVVAGAALATGLLSGLAGTANAAPGDVPPAKDRVIQPQGTKNLLVPTGANAGARIVAKPRIGQAQDTPESQVWTFDNSKKFDQNGKPISGGVSFVFQPTFGKPGVRALCIDVVGDSKQAGAAFELRPCDGTPSQVFVRVGDVQVPFVQNVLSGLNMEVQANGAVVQQPFVGRVPANATPAERQALQARNNAQHFLLSPKAFGVGGA
ncbi:RICIN domain-containing protein [Dactylosporangium sp. NPDC050588]|uniref:RICIN domain-containing protein n=1 Tax=Dactylosporangium sp. NPDC050588 TaxID=3157211 RepID=UPI0033E96F6B